MTQKTAIFLICAALASGCGGRRPQSAHPGDPNYQVVQEGQASGVTSTLNAPGETPPPMTDTNLDTTTNFTLPDNPAPLGTQPPNTVAGSLPPTAYPPYPQAVPSRPVMTPPPMSSGARPQPQPQPQPVQAKPQPEQPPPTDTAVTDEPLPPTDTAKTDTTETTKTETTKTDTTSTQAPPPPPPPV